MDIVTQHARKNYVWNLVGVLAQNAMSPLLLIAITRINGIDDSGLFSFAMAIAVVLWIFGMWGGRTFQVSDVKQEFSHRSYVVARLILATAMIVTAGVFVALNHYEGTKAVVILLLVGLKGVESIADALYGIMQVHHKLYVSGRSLVLKSILGTIVFLAVDMATKDLVLACASIIAANVLVILLYDLRVVGGLVGLRSLVGRAHVAIGQAAIMLKRTSPVFAVIFLSALSLNVPRYFIDRYHESEVGYFGILAMPITLIVLLMTFVLQPNVVQLSQLYAKKEYDQFRTIVRRILLVTVGLGFVIFSIALAIGVWALGFIFGVDFANYKVDLGLIVAGGVVSALVSVFINVLIVMRHFKHQFYALLVTNVVLIGISAPVVERYGMLGGIAAFALVSAAQLLLLMVSYKSIIGKQVKK